LFQKKYGLGPVADRGNKSAGTPFTTATDNGAVNMKKSILALAILTCLWAATPASADSSQPAPAPQAQTANATKGADCAQAKDQAAPAPQASSDAPQNQVEYGGGA